MTRPQTDSPTLVLALSVKASLSPEQLGSEILFKTRAGVSVLRYGELSAFDASGRQLPAYMRLQRGTIRLEIDARDARYPLVIDPFVQQYRKLAGAAGAEEQFVRVSRSRRRATPR